MSDFVDQFLKMQRDLQRAREPLGVSSSFQHQLDQMRDLGIGSFQRELRLDRMRDPFGMQSLQRHTRDTLGLGRLDELLGRGDGSFSFANRLARANQGMFANVGLREARALDLASSITDLTKISRMPFADMEKTFRDTSSFSLLKMMESTAGLDRLLASVAPKSHSSWSRDLERSATPWLSAHDALYPRDSLVLRMLSDERAFGVASWLAEPAVTPAHQPPYFELGAITARPGDTDRIDIDHEICCALCSGPIFSPASEAHWIAPRRMRMRTEVVPICLECTERDEIEPGYLRDALRAFVEEAPPSKRVELEVFDGEESDPVPRGRLTLVQDEFEPETEG